MEHTKTEVHRYISKHPIFKEATSLILGTIHPTIDENAIANNEKLDFFYGNRNSIWNILNAAFPQSFNPNDKNSIIEFLKTNKIAISDTIIQCSRKVEGSAKDSDIIPIEFNMDLKAQILSSNITKIYFTSGFGTNAAFRTFYINILGNSYIPDTVKNRLKVEIGNKIIECVILPSPSGGANVGLVNSGKYKEYIARKGGNEKMITQFKIDTYKDAFNIH